MRNMLGFSQKKHKDRYRIHFCDENFYVRYQNVFEMWQNRFKSLEKVEKLQAWVTVLSCLRRPEDWYGGPRALPLIMSPLLSDKSPDKIYKHNLSLSEIFADSPIMIPPKLQSSMDLFEFLNSHRIKALPESCFRSLCYMKSGRYPLRLASGVVSPFELLQIQLRGERIVSMDEDFAAWPFRLYSSRDYLGFILHDLIHADHFFYEPQHRDGQLGFYRFVNSFINDSTLKQLMSADCLGVGVAVSVEKIAAQDFRGGFEYIISDMNSHPLHLFQTLHSLLFKTLQDDVAAVAIWSRWIALAQAEFGISNAERASGWFNDEDVAALKRINARDFSLDEARCVENLCRKLAAKSPVLETLCM